MSVVCCKRKGGRDRNVVDRDTVGTYLGGRAENIVVGNERNWFIFTVLLPMFKVDMKWK